MWLHVDFVMDGTVRPGAGERRPARRDPWEKTVVGAEVPGGRVAGEGTRRAPQS